MLKGLKNTRTKQACRWYAISYPRASAIAYLRAHQNFKCVPPVVSHRAITCDILRVLAKKSEEELCDNKKKDPKSYFFYLW